jgi:hypothetical protein
MQKIISLFQRNYGTDYLVRNEIVPGAEWVLAGAGVATRKWDGACCRIKDGILWKRYEGKRPPIDFEAAQEPDPITGHSAGWVRCKIDEPADRWFWEAFALHCEEFSHKSKDGSYELVGPRINGNPDKIDTHVLIRHGADRIHTPLELTFEGIKAFLSTAGVEGIVWHHPDGRMVKIKAKDFGIKR